jgi:uncharacterized protein
MSRITALLLSTVAAVGIGTVVSSPTQAQDKDKKAKGKLVFEIYKDGQEEFRWRLKAANNKVIASSSDGYKYKADCKHGIDLVKSGAGKADVKDSTSEDK